MHSHLSSARLAPKKANLMAKMVRGLPVPDAVELLRSTSKKSARLFEGVLHSAIANAEHNFKQNAQSMIVKTVVVNQGTSYRRGIPMARGRVRPIRKFMCHISITLGFSQGVTENQKKPKKSKSPKNPRNVPSSSASSVSSDSLVSSSNSASSSQ